MVRIRFAPAESHAKLPRQPYRRCLDAMVVRIAGELMCLWHGVDHEGEVDGTGHTMTKRQGAQNGCSRRQRGVRFGTG